jgi:hypothetical protein
MGFVCLPDVCLACVPMLAMPSAGVHVVAAAPARRSFFPDSGEKDKLGRICKLMLKAKGVDEKEVKPGYKNASHGKVGNEKVGAGFEGKLATMRRFLLDHYPHLGLHEWNPIEKIGLPRADNAAAWEEFGLKWAAKDDEIKNEERGQKRPRAGPANASPPTEDPTIEGACALLLSALSARLTTLEPARHSYELSALERWTKAVLPMLPEALSQARSIDEGENLVADLAASLPSDDSLEVLAEPVYSSLSAADPAAAGFRSLSADTAPPAAAPALDYSSLSADDPVGSRSVVHRSLSADAAPPAAAPASPRVALERRLLQLLRSLPGSEAERRVELCFRVAAARAAQTHA